MSRHHVIISGTGRAGTTFLVQLLTVAGADTGFTDTVSHVFENCHAGMERNIRDDDAPYVIKSPWLCDDLDAVIDTGIVIDHAIVPVRDLFAAAESRRDVTRRSGESAPGGLWHTDDPDRQEGVLTEQFYRLVETLVRRDIPTTFLWFPRLVYDAAYTYEKLRFLVGDAGWDRFQTAYARVVQPSLVHDFTASTQRDRQA